MACFVDSRVPVAGFAFAFTSDWDLFAPWNGTSGLENALVQCEQVAASRGGGVRAWAAEVGDGDEPWTLNPELRWVMGMGSWRRSLHEPRCLLPESASRYAQIFQGHTNRISRVHGH